MRGLILIDGEGMVSGHIVDGKGMVRGHID